MEAKKKDLVDLKHETLKVIRGESKFSSELLNALLEEAEADLRAAQEKLEEAERQQQELATTAKHLKSEYSQLLTWADLYEQSSFEAKKMIVSQFVKAIRVGRNGIEIDFNVSFEEFQSYAASEGEIIRILELEKIPVRWA